MYNSTVKVAKYTCYGTDFGPALMDGQENCVDYYFMYMYFLYTLNFVNKKKYLCKTFYNINLYLIIS